MIEYTTILFEDGAVSTHYYSEPMNTSYPISDIPAVTLPAGEASVTMAAGEAAILTRIAEFAASYGHTHNHDDRSELFRLAREWRQEWRNKRNTT